jgi:hypothetical protein
MHAVLAELYRVFKPYRLGDDFHGCPCCVSEKDSQRLASKPLTELTADDLNRYAFKAMTTWGELRHFKHFLPRLLELLFADINTLNEPETLLGKLEYGKWRTWPPPERDAIQAYLIEFWKRQLETPFNPPYDDRVETALGGLAEAGELLSPYLAIWSRCESESSALHLAKLIDRVGDSLLANGRVYLYGEPEQQEQELADWLSSDAPRQLLRQHQDAVSGVFPFASAQLEGIRAARRDASSRRSAESG